MNNGLVKERMTCFVKDGVAYQAFNTVLGTAKVFGYIKIDHRFTHFTDLVVPHKIDETELAQIAKEHWAYVESLD